MTTGDVEIGYEMSKMEKKKKKKIDPNIDTRPILPTLARTVVKNPENFRFEDPVESEKSLAMIKVADLPPHLHPSLRPINTNEGKFLNSIETMVSCLCYFLHLI